MIFTGITEERTPDSLQWRYCVKRSFRESYASDKKTNEHLAVDLVSKAPKGYI